MFPTKDNLHHSLTKIAHVSPVEDEVESSPPVEVEKEKGESEMNGKKGKKGKKDKSKDIDEVAPSITNVTMRSTTKVVSEAIAASNATRVGSPFVPASYASCTTLS